MTESDAYPVINNSVYLATAPNNPYSGTQITNQLSGQSPNGNYYATTYAYDVDGRQYQTTDANGNITSNDLLYQTIYPSVAVGQPPSAVSNSYNALGNHPRLGPWLKSA
jgi:hypothetical protein